MASSTGWPVEGSTEFAELKSTLRKAVASGTKDIREYWDLQPISGSLSMISPLTHCLVVRVKVSFRLEAIASSSHL
jgi:hypothetical protein